MKREVLPLEEIEKYVSEVFFHKDEIRWAARIVKGRRRRNSGQEVTYSHNS